MPAGINTDDDTELYFYAQPKTEDYKPSLEVINKANDSVFLTAIGSGGLQKQSITLVENHQDTLKDDPTLVRAMREHQLSRCDKFRGCHTPLQSKILCGREKFLLLNADGKGNENSALQHEVI